MAFFALHDSVRFDCPKGSNGQNYVVFALYDDQWQANAAAGIDNAMITASVAAVPESEAYAMLLAGLCLLGFADKRRNAGNVT